ncbi:hypothetical protein CK203_044137 [Vitis vinifera]|uniref:Retrovirus-related Pol polyprotein from transposon TNT 1-94-like beta-barrel domain-containing protein n=1 Tax=Vitis vinifera TaxID=29760 RepID=A0A438I2Q8_VITVI|nr:hypothetical protein CK203_044137 [Vitis vinifera]
MTLRSPRKSKGIALNAIKEESLGSECEGDEKMSDGEVASVIEEPLKKEVPSESYESSDSDGDEMSFNFAYETLYKKCLSLKQEQVAARRQESVQEGFKCPFHSGFQGSTSNGMTQVTSVKQIWIIFTNFTKFNGGNVTFGDGNVASVKGKDIIYALSIPIFEEVLYVEGLKSNLISTSQICDKKFNVQFSKNLCSVFDLNGNCDDWFENF